MKKKNEQNLQKKKKNAELIERRRKKILDKYLQTEERIKKQKDENSKDLLNKYLTVAMKREDTINNLQRFERQQEFEREQKIDKLKKKDERLSAIKRQKTEIDIKKKQLNKSLSNRKKELVGKANNILTSGEYNNVDEIFKRVFNNDELDVIYNNNNKAEDKKDENDEYNFDEENKNDKGEKFFTTQQG